MEPLNFTVHVKQGACEMWGGSQVQATAQAAAAKVLGIAQDKVVFHNYILGGGFGRRLDTDMVEKAVRVAQKVDGPVKVIWSREEDMHQDMYRPAYRNVMARLREWEWQDHGVDASRFGRIGDRAHVRAFEKRHRHGRFGWRHRDAV